MKLFSKAGIVSLLILIGLLLLLFSGELVLSLVQAAQNSPVGVKRQPPVTPVGSRLLTPIIPLSPEVSATATSPITVLNHQDAPPLQLANEQYVIYMQRDMLYLVSIVGNYAQVIPTEGFISNTATPPILLPSGQILYSGEGIWMTSISGGTPTQIAPLDPGQVITSMALSDDGKMLAWSTEPTSGTGMIAIHAGPLANAAIVYEQSALDCPCFRIFSFVHGSSAQADHTLLLTDDRGSHEAVQYGLWSLDLSGTPATLQPILDENLEQQGPLALTPSGNTLLYASSEGAVPEPTDNSVPADIAALSYANSLNITSLSGSPLALGKTQVILPEQNNLSNGAQYHWVTTPIFSPDAHTLAYVEFSSDDQDPYDRHSALYTVQVSGSGAHLRIGKPQLLATTSSQLVELGPWFNNHTLTFYADGMLYAIDTQSGSFTAFAQPGDYARIIAAVGSPGS